MKIIFFDIFTQREVLFRFFRVTTTLNVIYSMNVQFCTFPNKIGNFCASEMETMIAQKEIKNKAQINKFIAAIFDAPSFGCFIIC